MLDRILSGYCLLIAVAVGIHFVVTPLYVASDPDLSLWRIFNWFMAVGVLIALLAGWNWKRRLTPETHDRVCLEVNTLFYGSVVLALWYFWNWFGSLVGVGHADLWILIDALFVIVVGAAGLRLRRDANEAG